MNGAITVMRPKLSRLSLVLGASGVLVAGMATAAYAATTANAAVAHTPTWHTILSVPDGKTPSNTVKTVVATGRTSGWAFLSSSPVAYERIASTAWKKVRLPEKGGAVSVAQASSPNNVWAAYHTATGTHLDRWNGRKWTTVKSFGGQINGISVLSPSDVWVFGVLTKSNGGVFHFNGRTWTQVSSIEQGGYAINDRNVWAFAGTNTRSGNPVNAGTDEQTNIHAGANAGSVSFVDRAISPVTGSEHFDDIVAWRTQLTLMGELNNASCYIPWR